MRFRHSKTRAVTRRLKPSQIEGLSSKPLLSVRDQRSYLEKNFDEDLCAEDLPDIEQPRDLHRYKMEVKREFAERANFVKKILISKQFDPWAKESNLLHWSAKQQILHLHRTDSVEWNAERLADEFPISIHGVKRLLRSDRRLTEEEVESHDREVDTRWKLLRKIRLTKKCQETAEVSLEAETIKLFLDNKLKPERLKAGNPALPRPSSSAGLKFRMPVGKEGKFYSILKDYKQLADGQPETEGSDSNQVVYSQASGRLVDLDVDPEIGNDVEAATHLNLPENLKHLARRRMGHETVTLEEFKEQHNIHKPPEIESQEQETPNRGSRVSNHGK